MNQKEKVQSARKLIAKVLRQLKQIFPRTEGHGWSIPKFHGISKMVVYMCLYGSGIHFYGGPGESHHKYPGDNTQRHVSEFARQITNHMYKNMIFEIANERVKEQDNECKFIGSLLSIDVTGKEFSFFGEY